MSKHRTLSQIVFALTGPIDAVGCSNQDRHRYENLVEVTTLVDMLVDQLAMISSDHKSHEASVKKIGEHAYEFLKDITLQLEGMFDEDDE